ncbi:hypothetical protein AsAng_0002670 [Aureispira anguillae]|uniref:Uncharacterized protein n=1 Tax=Aureispira anguillae TaxID=2864201 RepID=A0A915Y9K3_9BACT|nr:hypothetical protein AsAng_0002670 [Aureispira anguillae]
MLQNVSSHFPEPRLKLAQNQAFDTKSGRTDSM